MKKTMSRLSRSDICSTGIAKSPCWPGFDNPGRAKPNLLRLVLFSAVISLALLAGSIQFPTSAHAASPPLDDPPTLGERPFRLPFAEPSGPDTWLMAQPYGNTTGAYYRRHTLYGASGGIHFGVDLSAPCGTEIVAIADGVVFAVDGPFGSAPHNLMIDHPQLGYASMYGHLLEAPDLVPGQRVQQGQVVALVGDSAELCYRRPHLHLEIRDLKHVRKYNPARLIEADWDSLTLISSTGRSYMRDLDEPRKWQSLYDQPEARTGGPIINDFERTWPFDWSQREPEAVRRESVEAAAAIEAQTSITEPLRALPVGIGQQITVGTCCTRPYWNQDSTQVRFVDQPAPDQPLGIWAVDVQQPGLGPQLVTDRLGIYSPDGKLIAYPDRDKGVVVIERLADGQQWEIDTQEHGISFTPDSQGLIWTTYDEDAPRDTREETLWLSDVDGSDARAVFRSRRSDPVAWLANEKLLMVEGSAGTSEVRVFTHSLDDGTQWELMEGPRMRGLALSPDRRHMVYYVSLEEEVDRNGVWLLDLEDPSDGPEKLSFFGTYRWRDDRRLVYVPFDPDASSHRFYEYNVLTGQTRELFPDGTSLTIANNDWRVSPDGRQIVFVAADGTELDGIWVLEIDQSEDQSLKSRRGRIPS